jgi:hypothetical protein
MSELGKQYGLEDDSVYGGSMSAYEWYQAEMEVSEDMPAWKLPPMEGLQATLMGEEMTLHRFNTRIYLFNEIEHNGMTLDFGFLDHIYIKKDDSAPIWIFRPDDPESEWGMKWEAICNKLTEIHCTVTYGLPENTDYEQYYQTSRGQEDMEIIVGRILDEE